MNSEIAFPKLGLALSVVALFCAQMTIQTKPIHLNSPVASTQVSNEMSNAQKAVVKQAAVVSEQESLETQAPKYQLKDFAGHWQGIYKNGAHASQKVDLVINDSDTDPIGHQSYTPTDDAYFKCDYQIIKSKMYSDRLVIADGKEIDAVSTCHESTYELKLVEGQKDTIEVRFWETYRNFKDLNPGELQTVTLKRVN